MVHIDTTNEKDITSLTINGDIDASSSIQLDDALGAAVNSGTSKILINCGDLNYISSAGLGVFMSYIEDINTKNIKMAIFGLNEKVRNVFDILGLDQLLIIVNSEKEATDSVNEV
jgi:anti-sigma B factor antagonist